MYRGIYLCICTCNRNALPHTDTHAHISAGVAVTDRELGLTAPALRVPSDRTYSCWLIICVTSHSFPIHWIYHFGNRCHDKNVN